MSTHEHVTPQQVTDLVEYVTRFTLTPEELVEYPESRDLLEHSNALALLYEASSRFGKTQPEIIKTAKEYIHPCHDCMLTYELKVKALAYEGTEINMQGFERHLRSIPKLTAPEGLERAITGFSFTDDFKRHIGRTDVLGLLR